MIRLPLGERNSTIWTLPVTLLARGRRTWIYRSKKGGIFCNLPLVYRFQTKVHAQTHKITPPFWTYIYIYSIRLQISSYRDRTSNLTLTQNGNRCHSLNILSHVMFLAVQGTLPFSLDESYIRQGVCLTAMRCWHKPQRRYETTYRLAVLSQALQMVISTSQCSILGPAQAL